MATITVNSTASLVTALGKASGGDTIQLQSGVYSGLNLQSPKAFDTPVTITSADPLKPAIINDFTINKAEGLTFTNLEFAAVNRDVVADGSYWAFKVFRSNDIHFDNVSIHGSLDGDPSNDVSGLQFRWSNDVSVTNSEFQQVERGLLVSQVNGATVSGNNVHDMRSDGFDFVEVGNVKVTHNTFRDSDPAPGDHPDAIQFWTRGSATASHDILIADNAIFRGEGEDTHGIFMRDESLTMPYERVTITNNLVVGTGYHGISVGGIHDLTITGNTLASFTGDNKTWLMVSDSDDVTVTGNSANLFDISKSTRVVEAGNTVSATVSDHGLQAIETWMSAHSTADKMFSEAESGLALAKAGAAIFANAAAALRDAPVDDYIVGTKLGNLLEGFKGNDTLDGGGGADTLVGGAGDDVYIVADNKAKIVELAGEGVDTVIARGEHWLGDNIENLTFSTVDDRGWYGYGNALNNRLTGNAGANKLEGLAGNDTIIGGAGADTIDGGVGNDWLTGGEGADRFRFMVGAGHDVITDLGAGAAVDTLDITNFIKAGLKPTLTDHGHDTLISFSNGDSITVLGLHASDLGALSKTGWML